MTTRVFISKGSAATSEQRAFVDAILEMLDTIGLSARIMGENEWSHEQPLKAIRKVIRDCDGAVVIAFERTKFDHGLELKKEEVIPISGINLPTTWNHIEASIAYSYDLPLLVVAQKGLKEEGIIEDGYDWRVYWTDLNPEVIKSDSFKGFLQSWKKAVDEKKAKVKESDIDISKIGIGKILSKISIPQLWKLIGVIVTILSLVATTSYKLGAGKWPWQKEHNQAVDTTPTSAPR